MFRRRAAGVTGRGIVNRSRTGRVSEEPTFVLYRILGNDLPPRHRAGQTLANLRWLLANEPPLVACERRWVVNRIVDPKVEAELLETLAGAGQPVLHIPFSPDEYAHQPPGIEGLVPERYFHRGTFRNLGERARELETERYLEPRAIYAFNINGARNAALQDGRDRATWVLPWDGSLFIPPVAWEAFRAAAAAAGEARYLMVPMARQPVGDPNPFAVDPALAVEEPQIAFRRDAAERFDERLPYGKGDKAALILRLGVPGVWHDWALARAGAALGGPSADAGQWRSAGWVVRLDPGNPEAEIDGGQRHSFRRRSIVGFLRSLDERYVGRRMSGAQFVFFTPGLIARLRRHPAIPDAIAAHARTLLAQGFEGAGPTADMAPAGRRKAAPDPVTSRPQPAREQRRRSMQQILSATLGMETSRDRRYGIAAAAVARRLLVDCATAIEPELNAGQASADRNPAGIVAELRVLALLPFVLEATRRLEATGLLAATEFATIRQWSRRLLDSFASSPQGAAARTRTGAVGTLHDHVVLGLAITTGEAVIAREIVERAPMRIAEQLEPGGAHRDEAGRARPLQYALYNLEVWACLAQAMRALGFDPWSFAMADGRALARSLAHLLQRSNAGEGDATERRRLTVLAGVHASALATLGVEPPPPAATDTPRFHPDLTWWARYST